MCANWAVDRWHKEHIFPLSWRDKSSLGVKETPIIRTPGARDKTPTSVA